MTNRYSVTVSITLEIDAESESDARVVGYTLVDDDIASQHVSAIWVDNVSKCEEGKET